MECLDQTKFKRDPIIIKKIIALSFLIVIALIASFIVRHYFYMLDSYYYTAEFHLLFMKNNLGKENLELFTDYFKSMKTVEKVFPALLTSYLIQNYRVPFSKPILVTAVVSALGIKKGIILSYISLLLIGIISFGIGIFFLGDVLPLLKKKMTWLNKVIPREQVINSLLACLVAIPFVAVSIPATISALIRVPFKQILVIMSTGFIIRLILLVLKPGLFLSGG
jgi:hypothetical protein